MRSALIAILAAGLLPLMSAPAHALEPIPVGLGFAKIPGVPFDIIAAGQVAPYLEYEGHEGMRNALRAGFTSNLVTAGLHAASIASLWGAGFSEDEDAMVAALFINAGADVSIAVMGLATGVDILLKRKVAGIEDTDPDVGAKWSAWINIIMGGFGAVWFAPMVIAGLVMADDLAALPSPATSGLALRLEMLPNGVALTGRW